MVTTRLPKTIVKPMALGPVANTDTKLLIYGLFQKGRVLAQDGEQRVLSESRYCVGGPAATECRTSTEANTSSQDLNSHGCLPVNTRSSFLRITPWPSTRNARLISSQHFDGETNRHTDRPDAASIRRGLQRLTERARCFPSRSFSAFQGSGVGRKVPNSVGRLKVGVPAKGTAERSAPVLDGCIRHTQCRSARDRVSDRDRSR